MSLNQREDYNGRIAKRAKLADEKDLTVRQMISTISRGDEGIDEYFKSKQEKPIQKHKSMLDEFQL